MENFTEVKESILTQTIRNENLNKKVKACENWDELKEVITDNIWWCIYKDIELSDGVYKNNKREFTINKGRLHGEFKRWDTKGQLDFQCTFKEGKEHGEFKLWFDNGRLDVHCTYENGKKHGEYKRWHKNGELELLTFYKEGKLHGECKEYHDNGQLREHSFYKNGKLYGECKNWWSNGQLKEHYFYKDGEKRTGTHIYERIGDLQAIILPQLHVNSDAHKYLKDTLEEIKSMVSLFNQ